MSSNPGSGQNPERLAQRLTELEDQLRLSVYPEGGALQPQPALGRLESAARLLGSLESRCPGCGWHLLAEAATRLCNTARAHPERLPAAWGSGIERTAHCLECVLAELDDGLDVRRAAERIVPVAWSAGAEDPTAAELAQWSERLMGWEQQGLPAESDAVLRERAAMWREIRGRGDALFRAPLAGADRPRSGERLAAAGVQLGLLLTSPFQRQQLAERIQGLNVHHFFDPAGVVAWLKQEPQHAILLADNLEPSRHLERLLAQLPALPHRTPERCLLVAGALSPARPQGRRHLPTGADGVWAPPYSLDDLAALIIHS